MSARAASSAKVDGVVQASPARRWEISAIVCLAILAHAGMAYGAIVEGKKPRVAKRWTKVEVEMVRPPPPPPKPAAPPPEPPKPPPPPPPPKPIKAAPSKPVPVGKPEPDKPAPARAPEPPPPQDTGSSAPSDADGELHAGSGGLGVAPPAPPAPPAPAPRPAPVVQPREGANYLKNPRPAYPVRALREGWEGTTLLRVQVSPLGKPGAIEVQKSSGRGVLDEAALEAVKHWTFVPATQGGAPVSGWVTVPIVFKLQ